MRSRSSPSSKLTQRRQTVPCLTVMSLHRNRSLSVISSLQREGLTVGQTLASQSYIGFVGVREGLVAEMASALLVVRFEKESRDGLGWGLGVGAWMTKPKRGRGRRNIDVKGPYVFKDTESIHFCGPLSDAGFHVAQAPHLPRRTLNSSSSLSPPPKCWMVLRLQAR